MIPKPTPIAEITAKLSGFNCIKVTYASEDAKTFVVNECKQFG